MPPIRVMVNGLPGNMAACVAGHVLAADGFELVPFSLTGPEIQQSRFEVEDVSVELILPENRQKALFQLKEISPFISADYTHPSAVRDNAGFYCQNSLPFVMGTTGGDRDAVAAAVEKSDICALVAPNMGKQIVGFQAMMAHGAQNFPGIFSGFSLKIKESHQKGKADTSGTAKAMVTYFNDMGVPFSFDQIQKERDPAVQKEVWKVPEEFLAGHGWHEYTLTSEDGTVEFQFSHKVNGRDIYAKGTLDAVAFLNEKISQGHKGRVFDMMDVLRG